MSERDFRMAYSQVEVWRMGEMEEQVRGRSNNMGKSKETTECSRNILDKLEFLNS